MATKEQVLALKAQIERHTPAVRNDVAVLECLKIALEAVGLGPDGEPIKKESPVPASKAPEPKKIETPKVEKKPEKKPEKK